jgi:chemotaxis protein histidine kinase CheA
MNIDKNYFLDRLAAGENIDAIGQDIANMMNEALEAHRAAEEAKKAAAAKAENEAAKRDIIEEMIELVEEYAILEGMDEDEIKVSPEDVDAMVAAFTEMFATMRQLKNLATKLDAKKPSHKSDDDILNEFVKIFS